MSTRFIGSGSPKANYAGYWTWTGTWENLGVPPGSTVTQLQLLGYDYRCNQYDGNMDPNSGDGPWRLQDGSGINQATLYNGRRFSSTNASFTSIGAQVVQAVPSGVQPSATTIKLYIGVNFNNGPFGTGKANYLRDNVSYKIFYTPGTATPTPTPTPP